MKKEVINKNLKSNCCNADMTIGGDETHYFTCSKCGNPCDIADGKCPATMKKETQKWEENFDQFLKYQCIERIDEYSKEELKLVERIFEDKEYYIWKKILKDFIRTLLKEEKEKSYNEGYAEGINSEKVNKMIKASEKVWREELREKLEGMKRKEIIGQPEIIGYNQALNDVIKII